MKPLAHLASRPEASRGRSHGDGASPSRTYRDAFQRDRDRIVHSNAFRRLGGKTQVFVAPDGDHFRVRLTHSLEVAQIARTLARALGLNEDLTEAIALAHDLGHPPFGHAGEEALGVALADAGGFDHNEHTLRVLTRLECAYPGHEGLNLSWETLEGLAKHNGPVAAPGWALAEADAAESLDLERWPSLEAQIAAVADDIAYDNHDVSDGLRAGLIDPEELLAQPFVADSWRQVSSRCGGVDPKARLSELVREQIGRMAADVLAETRRRAANFGSIDEVRDAGRASAGFSAGFGEGERGFKRFLYERFYHHPRQLAVAGQARAIVAGLAAAYLADPALLSESWRSTLPPREPDRTRHIGDFIAGMTDRYAIARYREIVGQVVLPEGF